EDAAGEKALWVVRAAIPNVPIDRDHLIAAARLAGDYLVRMQRPDGRFYYYYNPATDEVDSDRYNIIRHEGAVFSLFELYRVTGDRRYLATAEKAVDFLKQRFKILPGRPPDGRSASRSRHASASAAASGSDAAYVGGPGGRIQLGANGLGLLAIVEEISYHKKIGDDEIARKLANMVLSMQRPDGSFETSSDNAGNDTEEPPSLYYPGEAMLALMDLYAITKQKTLLDAVRRGATNLMKAEKRQSELPPDAWFAQSLEKLYAVTGEREFAEHAIDLAVSMVDSQYGDSAPEGYAGGIAPGIPRAVQSASRAEGVIAGYRLSKELSDPRAQKLLTGLKSSARFEIYQQFTADNSFFLPQPSKAEGGIRESITSMRIRIDYVQHTISSLLGLSSITAWNL
ncbi:MAG TPA: hypothetical protein VEZ90_10680, partial [Blastocatellia bacterium]|nr:hypothetical protein [Blastocatellia bacterium]